MSDVLTTPPDAPVTPTQFLEDHPLYRKWEGNWIIPSTISRDCGPCEKETTWKYSVNLTASGSGAFKLYKYQCVKCTDDAVYFLIVELKSGARMKAGQFPRESVRVPSGIQKRLGASAEFYRSALTCRNEGYGLAAVAYFRRVVEDKTNELIDVVADAAEAHSVPAADVEKIRTAKNAKTYEDKLKIAAQAIPDVLKPDGANPLQAMHDILSVGIHTQSEDECLQIADETREIFRLPVRPAENRNFGSQDIRF